MSTHESMPWFVWGIVSLFGVAWVGWVYLMLARPEQWVEGFYNKPYRWCGLRLTIVDKNRFRRVARIYAAIPFLAALLALLVAGWQALRH